MKLNKGNESYITNTFFKTNKNLKFYLQPYSKSNKQKILTKCSRIIPNSFTMMLAYLFWFIQCKMSFVMIKDCHNTHVTINTYHFEEHKWMDYIPEKNEKHN